MASPTWLDLGLAQIGLTLAQPNSARLGPRPTWLYLGLM